MLFCGAKFSRVEVEKFHKHIQGQLDIIYEQFKYQPATFEMMKAIQYEVDKLYGEGVFQVTYDEDFDPYSFRVMIVNGPRVRQIMLELSDEMSCFKCKHCDWKYRDDCPFPLHEYVICRKGHEKTTYNTSFDEIANFTCEDYRHSYFIKEYYGVWFYIICFGCLGLFLLLSISRGI